MPATANKPVRRGDGIWMRNSGLKDGVADGVTTARVIATEGRYKHDMMDGIGVDGVRETIGGARAVRRRTTASFRPTARDREIVRWVHDVRVTTREQVQRLLFTEGGRSRCQERLMLLVRHRYLDKLPSGRANVPDVYVLSKRCVNGNRLLRSEGLDVQGRQRISVAKLQHALDIVSCRVVLLRACRTAGMTLTGWLDEDELASRTLRHGVLPDAYFQILRTTAEGERTSSFFLEVERSGKSERYWREKLRRLGKFYYGGDFERTCGSKSLRVLVLVSDDYGADPAAAIGKLAKLAEEARVTFLRFAPMREFEESGLEVLTRPIWVRPGDQRLSSLY